MAEIKAEIKTTKDFVSALKIAKGDPATKKSGSVVFLIGAGCSISAGIPSASDIARSMIYRLANRLCDSASTAPDDAEAALTQLQKNGEIAAGVRWENLYGQLFERYFQDPKDQQEIILQAVERSRGQINWAHLCLGELVAQHYAHTVLTTNFDQLVLEGMIRAGIIPVVADGIEALARVSGQPTHPQVVHLHGSLHTYNPRNSGADVRETDKNPAMQRAVYALLQANTLLVVVGYRGNEEGVMSLLISAAKDLRDKVIYWIAHDPDPDALSPQAEQLLGLGRHKYRIPGQDADQFFADIMRGLNLGIPSWMRDPVAALIEGAVRIAEPSDKDIKAEITRYRSRLNSLHSYWEEEDQQEKLKGELRQLRLSDKYCAAWERLRDLPDTSDPKLWEMRADSAYECGKVSGNLPALEDSVASGRRLLALWNKESDPEPWAKTQNNLGNALQALGEQTGGVEQMNEAVATFRAVLEVYTREQFSADWAATQNNLGNALQALGEQTGGVEQMNAAVAAFRAALEVRTREQFPVDWAMTQNNLGNALQALGKQAGNTEQMNEAVAAYCAALEVYTREQFPVRWAMTQDNLGNALQALGEQTGGVEQMNAAVAAFRAAQEVRTREQFPVDWGMTQNNLGNALQALGKQAGNTEQMNEAVAAYRAALEVCREVEAPGYVTIVESNLESALADLKRIQDKGPEDSAV